MCKSKIHRATVTEANLNYVGSITIDRELMDQAQILPYERVQIVNINNGTRVETYVLPGKRGEGTICLNGAAARWAAPGDLVIIISYGLYSDEEIAELRPRVVFVDEKNRIKECVEVDLDALD
ncbi:MAG TPA: aspartate 1-decarboxylase [Bacillota bacterium]|jgi:aspartate 1-decarboxylase|nr:aspartate 1-decarboxylase [Bacillota bacterium]